MILVAIILLIFLGISLNNPDQESVQSYEAESFLQSVLQYTTECRDNFGPHSVNDLVFECFNQDMCLDGQNSCDILESALENILSESWSVGEESPIEGYEFYVVANAGESDGEPIIDIEEGNTVGSSKGASSSFSKGGGDFDIYFSVYY